MKRSVRGRGAGRLRVLGALVVALAAPAAFGAPSAGRPPVSTDAPWATPGPAHPPRVAAAAAWMRGDRIDPARATPGALALVPGIGPVRAHDLAEALADGRVRSAADLRDLHGFGPVLSSRVSEHLHLDP